MNFVNHLFGTIAGGNIPIPNGIDFIPSGLQGQTIQLTGKEHTAQWWGMKNKDMQKKAYDYCYPVSSVIDRMAYYDIAGRIEILRSTGKGKDNYATNTWAVNMNKLLAQPNPLQTWEQFRGQQVIYKKIFGWCPVLPFIPSGFTPDMAISIVNLPPWCLEVTPQKKYINPKSLSDIVKDYKFRIFGEVITLKPEQLIILEDSFMQDSETGYILPQSQLVGLDYVISNICAAMEADNVLLKKKGPLGFISPELQKDTAGFIPYDAKDKAALQNSLNHYGLSLSQYQYVISNTPTRWNPMSYDVKQLGTKETLQAGEKAICHRFGFPYTLYEQQDATYANGSAAEKGFYQNNIIPNNSKDLNKYNKFFKAAENNAVIVNNYEGIAALQEDKLLQAQAAGALNNALSIEYESNLITLNQWRVARGYDTIPDGDTYKKDTVTEPTQPINDPNILPV